MENIMEILNFPTMDLIENACPPKLMIEQVERRCNEVKEKIPRLGHISIEDMDRLIRQPLAIEGNIHIFFHIWHKLAINEMENFKCDSQLGFDSTNYPNIDELLGIWTRWQDFLGY